MVGEQGRLRSFGLYWLERHKVGTYYIAWYDAEAQQTRRRTLGTADRKVAAAAFDRLASSAVGGDPMPTAAGRARRDVVTVTGLLEMYEAERGAALASSDQVKASVRWVREFFGLRSVSVLGPDATEEFVAWMVERGVSLGYASRIVGVLRSAVRRAHERRRIPELYSIPNPQRKADKAAAPPKGRVLSSAEIARLIDATDQPHMLAYLKVMLGTAARNGPVIDLMGAQIDVAAGIVMLNPPGRPQTGKYRPTVRLIEPLRRWAAELGPGPVVAFDGGPVKSIRTAWRAMCRRAGLPSVTTYSLRYTVARRMRAKGVPTEQISVQLGHVPVDVRAVTLVYSPYSPAYLDEAAAVISEFYSEVSRLVKNPKW